MSTKTKPLLMVIFVLLISLAASCYTALFLFKQAKTFYTREAFVRLTPIDYRYREANQALLAEEKTKPRLVIFGESRAEDWGDHPAKDWGDIQFVNRGIGGESTEQIRARLQEDVLALDPDLVILQMGDNDIKTIAVLEPRTEQIVRRAEENIRFIASAIAEQGTPVLITTIFPTKSIELKRRPLWSDAVNDQIDAVNQRLLDWDHPRITVADCDAFLREGRYIKPSYARDTLHLNQAGYEALNENLRPLVRKLIGTE